MCKGLQALQGVPSPHSESIVAAIGKLLNIEKNAGLQAEAMLVKGLYTVEAR